MVLPGKREKTTLMRIERVPARFLQGLDRTAILHEGRGQHSGTVILKPGVIPPNLAPADEEGDVTLQFRCYLLHGATGKTSIVRLIPFFCIISCSFYYFYDIFEFIHVNVQIGQQFQISDY